MRLPRFSLTILAVALACAPKQPVPEKQPAPEKPLPKPSIDPGRVPADPVKIPKAEQADTMRPMVPPETAYAHGWMPLASTGVEDFLRLHPTYDGRGVLIGILDTGIDAGIAGLGQTSTENPKLLDLRDFSREGAIPLKRVTPTGDSLDVAGRRYAGFGRVAALNTSGPYYAGVIREIPLGPPPASDINGNGIVGDTLALVVTRASDGWVMFADTDGDRSFAGEKPIHDYLQARETFGWAARGRPHRLTVAANFSGSTADPQLDLVFDITSHGSHVAGIAAGYDLYGVTGFSGVAPGAQLLGLKIANSAQGSVTTSGSMLAAMDYAIRFAGARRLPLVLNMSFGVGNEIEGRARIDALVDSVLAAHPGVVFAISVGNDGPGLSTLGFPGSARRAISVGATLPASFLPPGPGGPARDQLAYFSSRGGELAKPDIITPGVAYSTVPRWSTGQEVEQGTSMAAPHGAGLAALLISALAQEKRPIDARAIKQALMVTAHPLPGATFVDEGTGLPNVESAYRWLQGNHQLPDVTVRVAGDPDGRTAAFRERGQPGFEPTQRFELLRPASAPKAVYRLRSDAPWLSAPPRVTLSGPRTVVTLKYDLAALEAPGALVGTVTGWSTDSLAGPIFRLVSTLVSPDPITPGTHEVRSAVPVEPGALLRTFFRADSARPFEVRVQSKNADEKALAFLHEPDGMPFRDESARPVGSTDAAIYQVDGRDAVAGPYEVVVFAPTQPISATVSVSQSPLLLHFSREKDVVAGTLQNPSSAPVQAEVVGLLGGGERVETVVARGSDVRRIPFVAPSWAKAVVVDVNMDRAQWGRFTDFGVTLFDSIGRQIEKQPLNYAIGRLQASLPEGHGNMPLELRLFPGFADSTDKEPWNLRATIRLYADSAVALERTPSGDRGVTVAPGASSTVSFALPPSPWALGDGFFPLGVLVARVGDHTYTREAGLPVPNPAMMR
jgi:tripeptidyl-peptidase II